MKDSFRDFKSK